MTNRIENEFTENGNAAAVDRVAKKIARKKRVAKEPDWVPKIRALIETRTKTAEALAEFDRQAPAHRAQLKTAFDRADSAVPVFADALGITEKDVQKWLGAPTPEPEPEKAEKEG